MAKSGKLSLTEKASIQTWLSKNISVEKMAEKLDRSENIINKYINGELDTLLSNIAEVQLARAEKEKGRYSKANENETVKVKESAKVSRPKEVATEEQIRRVRKDLLQAGLIENDVEKILEASLNKYADLNRKVKEGDDGVADLYNACIRVMKAGQYMIKKSQGGREGVAIMTPAASQKMNDSHKTAQPSRTVRDNVFRPNG